ncbi:uncharacterized protein LOC121375714 [Gigantopelta aegis]|uniref:uncharacterized protein LOC121375714 n=1 Tax=Gigantopelta aegis TaxID=1735272 RepID=UPI001B88AB93|nr:uncharacterized protein LOC121375714 [Gigantopelta aegis]
MTTRNNALAYVSKSPTSFPGYKPTADQAESSDCVCERPVRTILCRSCGYIFPGRLRVCCPVHQTTIHLMDINCCPNCRAVHLKEFKSANVGKKNTSN